MNILLTGVAGFIGYHVAQALLERGDAVVGVDNLSPYYDVELKRTRLKQLEDAKGFTFHRADIADKEAMERVFAEGGFTKVCHLAAQAGVRYSLTNPYSYERSNCLGTLTLLELCRHYKVNHFVFASSSSVYGKNEPPFSEEEKTETQISVYAATKKFTEVVTHAYSHLFGIKCTGIRFFTVYGPWGRPDMALFKFTKNILAGEPIEVYNEGRHKRDFTYVADTVQGVLAALDKEFAYELFNLARGESIELNGLIAALEEALGRKTERKLLPLQPGDVKETSADISKARELLGYSPKTSIQEGVREFVKWYKEYNKVPE